MKLLLLLLLLLFHFFVWSGAETAWEGGLTLEARLGRALASGDQRRQPPPFLFCPHWEPGGQGARGFRGCKGAGGEPGAAKNEKNCPARASGEVTAADISRIVAVSQSVSSSNYSGHRQRGGRLTEGGGGWGVSSGGQSD